MSGPSVDRVLQEALAHHSAGRLREAEAIYRQILAREPRNAHALHLLGVLAHQVGNAQAAEHLIRSAIEIQPASAELHNNFGEVLRAAGRVDEALASYQRALEIQPNYPDAQFNIGLVLMRQSDLKGAAQAFQRVVQLSPDHADAHNNLGVVLWQLGRVEEAVGAFRRAIEKRPTNADWRVNLAAALESAGRFEEARQAAAEAVRLAPTNPRAHINLGTALQRLDKPAEAMRAFARAVELDPNSAAALNGLGYCLIKLNRKDEALPILVEALRLAPDDPEALNNYGTLLTNLKRYDESIQHLRRALALKPDFAKAHSNLGVALQMLGQYDQAIDEAREAARLEPTAETFNNLALAVQGIGRLEEAETSFRLALELNPNFDVARSNLLLAMSSKETDPQKLFEEHRAWDRHIAAHVTGAAPAHSNVRDPDRRLRVGYVSADFRQHSVSFFFEPLIEHHDHQQVQVFCYSAAATSDAVTERVRNHADEFRTISDLAGEQLAETIRRDAIDILVDLSVHTKDNRLPAFALRPAPVQVSYLGYFGTTGLSSMDYRITDRWVDPPGMTERFHTEKLVRLEGGFCCYRPPDEAPDVGSPPARENGYSTFGSFAALWKVTSGVMELWAQILRRAPDARLLLQGAGTDQQNAVERIRSFFQERSVDPQRLILRGPEPFAQHLRTVSSVDLVLDTYPFNGHTTTCHALWMGAPVVSVSGRTPVSRVGASLLNVLGLTELVAESAPEYAENAIALAQNVDRLEELRRGLRQRMKASPLLDSRRLAREVEATYRAMWRNYCIL